MAAAKPSAASETGAPFCWPKDSKLCTPGAEAGTGWRSSTSPDRCLQAWSMAVLREWGLFGEQLARSCAM